MSIFWVFGNLHSATDLDQVFRGDDVVGSGEGVMAASAVSEGRSSGE